MITPVEQTTLTILEASTNALSPADIHKVMKAVTSATFTLSSIFIAIDKMNKRGWVTSDLIERTYPDKVRKIKVYLIAEAGCRVLSDMRQHQANLSKTKPKWSRIFADALKTVLP